MPRQTRNGHKKKRNNKANAMTALVIENFKLIVLALWIGATVGLAKLGSATRGGHARTISPASNA